MLAPLLVSGCATILHGTKETVSIVSQPPGAAGVIMPGEIKIQTPATVELHREQIYTVHLELPGYIAQNAYLTREVSAVPYGNLVLGGVIGMIVDIEDGANFHLDPNPLEVTLQPESSVAGAAVSSGSDAASGAGSAGSGGR